MRHMIIGAGNLGKDLLIEINAQRKGDPEILSRSRGGVDARNIKELFSEIEKKKPDYIWYCVGGGSVAEAKMNNPNYNDSLILNVQTPINLIHGLKERNLNTKLVLFSSDYAANEENPSSPFEKTPLPRSNYAKQKIRMEVEARNAGRGFTTIVRVGSLYGVHKPERTFIGKFIDKFLTSEELIGLPSNIVVPTPTRWLAYMLIKHIDFLCPKEGLTIEHVAPSGGITVRDWGRIITEDFEMGEIIPKLRNAYFDYERPVISGLGNSLLPHGEANHNWYELFLRYYNFKWFSSNEAKDIISKFLNNCNSQNT